MVEIYPHHTLSPMTPVNTVSLVQMYIALGHHHHILRDIPFLKTRERALDVCGKSLIKTNTLIKLFPVSILEMS